MIPVITITLIVTLLAVALVAVALFFRAAFMGQQDLAEQEKATTTWRPPFLRGTALRDWAATSAEQWAQRRLTRQRTAQTAIELVTEVQEGAGHALMPLAQQAELERVVACPETGQGIVGLTAPEVLAIAAYVRTSRSANEQKQIHDRAVENAKRVASSTAGEQNLPRLSCPLLGQDCVCRAFQARPLCCRPLHAMSVAQGMGSRSVDAAVPPTDAQVEPRHEQTVAQGIELGLSKALNSSGLDGNVYELNGALAKALELPDAAERWVKGETVFAGCATR